MKCEWPQLSGLPEACPKPSAEPLFCWVPEGGKGQTVGRLFNLCRDHRKTVITIGRSQRAR